MELTIDRSRWRTGQESKSKTGEGLTCLLNREGYMCCLGFAALAMGAEEKEIYDVAEPYGVDVDLPLLQRYVGEIHKCNSDLAATAIELNDYKDMSSTEREEKIQRLFAKHGINITFINEYVRHGDKLTNKHDKESDVSEEVEANS